MWRAAVSAHRCPSQVRTPPGAADNAAHSNLDIVLGLQPLRTARLGHWSHTQEICRMHQLPAGMRSLPAIDFVVLKAETAWRARLARFAQGRVSGLSDGALDYLGLRMRGIGSKCAVSATEPRSPWRYVRCGGVVVNNGPATNGASRRACRQVMSTGSDLSGRALRIKSRSALIIDGERI